MSTDFIQILIRARAHAEAKHARSVTAMPTDPRPRTEKGETARPTRRDGPTTCFGPEPIAAGERETTAPAVYSKRGRGPAAVDQTWQGDGSA